MNFQFATAAHILFGPGIRFECLEKILTLGIKPFILTGSPKDLTDTFIDEIRTHRREGVIHRISGEPSIPIIDRAVREAGELNCDMVIAIGGGSVIDTGKAVAALIPNGNDCMEFLEVVGQGHPLTKASLPMIAFPTTAGTGSEVTKNAVIRSPEHNVKVSMRSESMIPRYAVVDPELCLSMPVGITASTGLDALTQLLEAYVTKRHNPLVDGICKEGIVRASRSIVRVFENGSDIHARTDMSCAGLFSGLALANAGLGAVHGFAGPIGGMFDVPHGMVCASLLPHVFSMHISLLEASAEKNETFERYEELSRLLTGSHNATPEQALEWIRSTCKTLDVPRLSDFGIRKADFPVIAEKALQSSSMKGNPMELNEKQLNDILEEAF